MESITEIKEKIKNASLQEIPDILNIYAADTRDGVRKLIAAAQKKTDAFEKEKVRIYAMEEFERQNEEKEYICGIDEVGRGPLAGPVVAGAVILPKICEILYLNDSKQLSEKKREELYDIIMEKAIAVGIGAATPARIDEINILQADYEAMAQAVGKLTVKPDVLLIDAVHIPQLEAYEQISIIKGDAKSVSIAAASIVAKVTRDRLMKELDAQYPVYGFAQNKGYGSAEHIAALKKYGPCPLHRRSFIGHFVPQ